MLATFEGTMVRKNNEREQKKLEKTKRVVVSVDGSIDRLGIYNFSGNEVYIVYFNGCV